LIVTVPYPFTDIRNGDFVGMGFDDDGAASVKNTNIDNESGQNRSVFEAGESSNPSLEGDSLLREVVTTTRSGRDVCAPQRLIAQTNGGFEHGENIYMMVPS
jgi:hypothetical protein